MLDMCLIFAEKYQAGDERKSIVLCLIYFKVGLHMYFVLLYIRVWYCPLWKQVKKAIKCEQFSLLSF